MLVEAFEDRQGGSPVRGLANLSSITGAEKYVAETAKEYPDLIRWDVTSSKSGRVTAQWIRTPGSTPKKVK